MYYAGVNARFLNVTATILKLGIYWQLQMCKLQTRQSNRHAYNPLARQQASQIPPRTSSLFRNIICGCMSIEQSTWSWPQTNIVSKNESFNPEWWDMGDGEKLKAIPGSGERSIQTTRGRTVSPCPPTPSHRESAVVKVTFYRIRSTVFMKWLHTGTENYNF